MILSTHGIVGSQITQFVGLLDLYPSAAAAYSLRKLRSAYTGSAIRVRRASDNAEQDIAFTGLGRLDTSSLTSFCSGTNGFVKTWYDQSGNSRDATQATAANQPQIVSSGSVILENGNPTVQFDGSNDFLNNNTFSSSFLSNLSSVTVSKINNELTAVVYGFGNNLNNNSIRYFGSTSVSGNENKPFYQDRDDTASSNVAFVATGVKNTQHLAFVFSNYVDNRTIVVNSVNSNNNTQSLGTITLNTFALGALLRTTNALYLNGIIQEIVLYPSDQSSNRTGIETNIAQFYNIY